MRRALKIALGIVAALLLIVGARVTWVYFQYKAEAAAQEKAEADLEKAKTENAALRAEVARKIYALSDLGTVVTFAKGLMANSTESSRSQGEDILAEWTRGHVSQFWTGLQTLGRVSSGEVLKDPDACRGGYMCIVPPASVVQISRNELDWDGIIVGIGPTISFRAVGSTSGVVADSRVRFCGVVTGTDTYTTRQHSQVQAVRLVGEFDLPENR